ncbi:MAG: hypothetical protein HY079_01620 [Elusimicrobia bacterium]|nr:hypothetical protein [Elusimicrobiota bacterium]
MRLTLLLLLAALPARADELAAAADDARALVRAAQEDARVPPAYRTALPPAADEPGGAASCVFASAPGDGGLQLCVNEAEVHGFQLTNSASPRVNPFGRAVKRQWEFMAPGRARRELGLLVYEWASPDAGADDSANSMLTELVFLPRRVVPAIRLLPGGAAYEVALPTGETMLFDAATKEVAGGPLAELGPIDANPDRHARRFAALRYSGSGIMIRSDQRGDTPRSAVVWGIKKLAVATWGAKTCRFSPAEVWKQDADGGGSDVLYPTDAGFYAMLKRKCGWDVTVPSGAPRP